MGKSANSTNLTVVIPHYNHIELLPGAVASVLDQNIPEIEILIVDDGSEPSCLPVLEHIERTQSAVRLIRYTTNRGSASST